MNSIQEIQKIVDRWFVTEPIYFMTQCVFRLTPNETVCKFAAARGHLYFNPKYTDTLSLNVLEECLKVEYIRILLKHPFGRYNHSNHPELAFVASECVIAENMQKAFKHIHILTKTEALKLYSGANRWGGVSNTEQESYEQMYRKISAHVSANMPQRPKVIQVMPVGQPAPKNNTTTSLKTDSDEDILNNILPGDIMAENSVERRSATHYWNDDFAACSQVNRVVDHIRSLSGRSIGSVPLGMIEKITADEAPAYDYREALRRFRHNTISSVKRLTRMRPSRRYGYEQMGSVYDYKSNILVVCDASGSMTTPMLNKFLGFANQFFKYGVSSLDVVTFDTQVYDDSLKTLVRKTYEFECHGRGGTDIDDILNFVNERSKKKYDGVVVFTDGGYHFDAEKWFNAAGDTNYIFCVTEDDMYESHKKSIEKYDPNGTRLKITYIDANERNNR